MEEAGLRLAPIFSDGMILQRDTCNHIYGSDTKASLITIAFMKQEFQAKAGENGTFDVVLPGVAAGGPYELTVKGSSEITISDLYFGDVYLLTGQSNMQLPIRRVLDVSQEEVSRAHEPFIRQYLMPPAFYFKEPLKEMYAGIWKQAAGEDLQEFSAAGYFFAKEIKEAYQVPVGLILTAAGGSSIEAWMSPDSLAQFGDYEKQIRDFKDPAYFEAYIRQQQDAADAWIRQIMDGEGRIDSENYRQWNTCKVPSLVSDYTSEPFYGSVYLCREVILKEEPVQEDAFLYLGSIIDADQVWINGELIGRTEYRYPPRKYPFSKNVLRKGSNLIVVRILINGGNGGTIAEKPYHLICNGIKYDLSGEWHYKIGKRADTARPEVLFPPKLPTCFYNTVEIPLSRMSIKGILWYQGESNTEAPEDYADKFSVMVRDWRRLYGWEVPFLYVQLANYREPLNTLEDTGWAELRDQQRSNLSLPKVAMAVIFDVGEHNDLHPQNKKMVGVRLAKAADHLIYGKTEEYSGPVPLFAVAERAKAKLFFEHLEYSDAAQELGNFELAGEDGIFHTAQAHREGKEVIVFSGRVTVPAQVRYAWCDSPGKIDFYNEAGLPAAGFRMKVGN